MGIVPLTLTMLPKTIKDAAAILLSEVSDREKLKLRNTKKENLILYHLTWGEKIRNRFGLWSGNEKDAGENHPDSVSMKIMEEVWDKIQKE